MANIAEMERVLTHITDHPEQHNQGSWTCNTGACYAGHTVLLNGYRARRTNDGDVINGVVISPNGRRVHDVRDVATDILDIDTYEADLLFCGSNTRDDLAMMVKDAANGEKITARWRFVRKFPSGQVMEVDEYISYDSIPLDNMPTVVVIRSDDL